MDPQGFDALDRKLLLTIIEKFDGGPVGIESLAAALGEERGTLEDVVEPFLIQQGFLMRTARGRIATRSAYRHFGRKPPQADAAAAPCRCSTGNERRAVRRNFTCRMRVYWEDTDGGGVVYYANYLRFMERARTEWLRALGIEQVKLRAKNACVRRGRGDIRNHRKPARLDDELVVSAARRGASRARHRSASARRLARGEDAVELARQAKCARPASMRQPASAAACPISSDPCRR